MLNGKNNIKITNKNDSKLSAGTTLFAECQVIERVHLDYDIKE